MKLLFFIFVLISCFLLINCQVGKKKSSSVDDDDDEFAMFDDFDDDTGANTKTAAKTNDKQSQQTQQQQQQQQQKSKNEFDELDITVEEEDEDEDDEYEKPAKTVTQAPTTKSPTPAKQQQQQQQQKAEDKFQNLDDEEFENFVDDEEFEGFDETKQQNQQQQSNDDDIEEERVKPKKKAEQMPDLKIANVPEHLMNTNNWKNYYLELIMITGLLVYIANMLIGKSKNSALANAWFESNRSYLEKNFALVGDDGSSTDITSNENAKLVKESDNIYGLWCSGRLSCLNMFVQLKFIKRQDLISVINRFIKPQNDQIIISVEFERKDLDSYVFCLANRKQTQNLMKDYQDISTYCVEKKQLSEKYDLDSKYVILNEIGEIPASILDNRVCHFLKSNPDLIEYILISDQYVGYKIQQDDQQNVQNKPQTANTPELTEPALGLQNCRAMMIVCVNIPKSNKYSITPEDVEKTQSVLPFVFYLIDKLPRVLLSKEAKLKSIKRRKDITEQNMKIVNKQRQEAAQLRKEEKRRAEKEKIMNESDPEKQKKLEEKELKREKKRGQPKLKQIKIKSI